VPNLPSLGLERLTGEGRGDSSRRGELVVATLLLAAWLTIVIFTASRHEYWRDEIRPWSLAGAAHSPLDLFHRIRYEGHPILWYLILYLARSMVDTPLALPITSIAIAGAAVAIFMLRSPFPLWMKAIFLFSALPLYEYSVMARDYGISMLLLFLVASLYHNRSKRWLSLSIALALLANTNIHATILTCLLMVVWAWDELRARKVASDQMLGRRFLAAVGIVSLGVALSVLVVSPPRDTILTGFYSRTASDFTAALRGAVLEPSAGFAALFPPFVPWVIGHVVLYLAVFGLLRRPALSLAAAAGLVAMGVLFRAAYGGSYRHTGVFLSFLVCLYWMACDAPDRGTLHKLGMWLFDVGRAALVFLVLASVYKDPIVLVDIRSEMSSSKALGAFLRASPAFHDAILVPEPDYFIEALPYYAPNPIYLPREHRFGTMSTWSSAADVDLSLEQVVSAAQGLKTQYGRPVLVVFGHPALVTDAAGDIRYLYNKHFTWTTGEREVARRSLTPVAQFVAAVGDENYWVYAVK